MEERLAAAVKGGCFLDVFVESVRGLEGCQLRNGKGSGSSSQAARGDRVKGPWSPEEDVILSRLVSKFRARNWSLIACGIAGRSGKSCRPRWCNQLDSSVKRKPITNEEESSEYIQVDRRKVFIWIIDLMGQVIYGTNTAALSTASLDNGLSCGSCYEVKCVNDGKRCLLGSLVITATSLRPPNNST
ncbi:transcription factor MYB14-like [Vitis riparia]|uniref:transcription factor MYB14-like n=1 Tax=Vitis riparia TaxID=96939 RepID=UPI00155B3FDF|nr:transcription factor MYB14-like [Vitis riparia]